MESALLAVQDRAPRDLLRAAFSLWALLALLGIILVVVVAVLLAGRHIRRLLTIRPRRRPHRQIDPWTEAGKRARPVDVDTSQDQPPEGPAPEERYS